MIELKNLTVGYPGRVVLERISLNFGPGTVTVLLGPNGSGKSTLMRTVLGLQPKLEGEVLVDGAALEELELNRRARKLSYLAQSRTVPNITAERLALHGRFPYLSYPRRYRPEDREAVRAAMERTGAAELAGQLLPRLSEGQRQRAYLAMTLAQDTPYVFFDEPTTYLDVGRQLEVMETARALAREGKAVVLVLHDLPLALRSAHRVVVLNGGGVASAGTPEEVYESGALEQAFGVKLRRIETQSGWRYYYE